MYGLINVCIHGSMYIYLYLYVFMHILVMIRICIYVFIVRIHISLRSNSKIFYKISIIITPLQNYSEQTLLKRGQNVNTCRTAVSSDFLHNAKLMGIRERAIKQMRCFSIHSSSIFAPSSTFLVNDAKCFQNITILAVFDLNFLSGLIFSSRWFEIPEMNWSQLFRFNVQNLIPQFMR